LVKGKKQRQKMIDPFLNHLWECEEGFEEYRDFMYENYEMVMEHKTDFIKDSYFSTSFKCERIRELIDFFVLEEEFERCDILQKLFDALEVDHLFSEVIKNYKVKN